MEASIVVTYKCNARCEMCDIWKYPSKSSEEITPADLEKLPFLDSVTITGGEPFMRNDIEEIVQVLRKKSKRLIIVSNGYFSEKILQMARKYPDLGFRFSVEGFSQLNDKIRGLKNGFDTIMRTLLELKSMKMKDIGFGFTLSDINAHELIPMYELAEGMNVEFSTAALHNSFFFHKDDNTYTNRALASGEFQKLKRKQLDSHRIKDWFRAYFTEGLIHYTKDEPPMIPCEAGTVSFFIDPFGEVLPCNGMEKKYWFESMGNIKRQTFDEIWNGEQAKKVRGLVRNCQKNCWMTCNVAPSMRKRPWISSLWILKNKLGIYKNE